MIHTPMGGDFLGPVSYALNFKKSFEDGQYIPRLIIPARTYPLQDYTNDRTPPTPDGTALMYYCFLPSALAYPFLKVGFNGKQALGGVILFSFIISSLLLFSCGRVLNASRTISVIAAFSYLLSPWPICNILTRGGVAEGVSHALLPLVFLGIAFILRRRPLYGISFLALGIFLLALAHNIFLLWGCSLCLIFALLCLIYALFSREKINSYEYKIPVLIGMSVIIGLLMSIWHWLPAILTLENTNLSRAALNASYGAGVTDFCDLSGVFGWIRVAVFQGVKTNLFYTIGWWTVPSVVFALAFSQKAYRKYAISSFLMFIIFSLFTYFPAHTFKYLPAQFNATQGTYRLLAFLSCIGAFSLCFFKYQLRMKTVIVILSLIVVSQLPVFHYPHKNHSNVDDDAIGSYELNDYHPNSPFSPFLRHGTTGGLFVPNVIDIANWFNTTVKFENNKEAFSDRLSRDLYLVIKGELKNSSPINLVVSSVDNPKKFMLDDKKIASNKVDVNFYIKNAPPHIRLETHDLIAKDEYYYSLILKEVYLIEDTIRSYIHSANLLKTKRHGYQREFVINSNVRDFSPNKEGFYTIELPMIYNKFIEVSQKGTKLVSWCDFNHRINVKTSDITSPILARFLLPAWIINLSIAGLFIWGAILTVANRRILFGLIGNKMGIPMPELSPGY